MAEKQNGPGMTVREARARCQERGVSLTPQGIIWAGMNMGFIARHGESRRWSVDRAGLEAYLDARTTTPPQGWMLIQAASAQAGVSINTVYFWIRKKKIDARVIGPGTGKLHVNFQELKQYAKSRSK